MTRTELQQPALVATSIACLRAVSTLGIEPDYVIGHSVGEYSALAAADAIGTGDAVALVRERGEAMAEAARENPGAMAAVLGLDDAVVEDSVLLDRRSLAGELQLSRSGSGLGRELRGRPANRGSGGPRGPKDGEAPRQRGLPQSARRPRRRAPEARAGQGDLAEPLAALHVYRDGAKLEDAQRMTVLLAEQLTAPVRFTQAVARAGRRTASATFVEIGPGQVLSGLLRRCDRSLRAISVNDPETLRKLKERLAGRQ